MATQFFNVGDRVRMVAATASVRVGMIGTIQQIYLVDRVFYEVTFDSEVLSRLIAASDLERLNDAQLDAPTARHV